MPEPLNSHAHEAAPPSPKPLASWYTQGVSDGLGDRLLMFDNSGTSSLELLRFHQQLARIPGFEAALRDQVRRLDRFRHPAFARVRSVQRLEPDDDLALVSNSTPGKRLSEVLSHTRGADFAAELIRQLGPALAQFQQQGGGTAHGLLSPDRIVVSPEGRLTIVEHVVGPALGTLDVGAAQLSAMGVALPPAANGGAPLDAATDWYQLGLVALSVLLGRAVTANELPRLEALLDSEDADGLALPRFVREWLDRALQLSGTGIESAADARDALEELLQKERTGDARRLPPAPLEADLPPLETSDELAEVFASPAAPDPVAEILDPVPEIEVPPAVAVEPFAESISSEPVIDPSPAVMRPTIADEAVVPKSAVVEQAWTPAVPDPPAADRPRAQSARPATPRPSVRQPSPERPAVHHPPPAAARPVRPKPAAAPAAAVATRKAAAPSRTRAARTGTPRSISGALAAIAAVEALIIVGLAYALWGAPPPPLVVEAAASGNNMLVSRRADAGPLRVETAPDLGWVRVTSASAAALTGAPETETSATIRISSPISLKVLEGSRQVGSVPGADVKLPAGRHDLVLVNAALGYQLPQRLDVRRGETLAIHVAPAQGSVTLYAVPSAEVTIDGHVVGRTPLGPLALPLGEHEVIFRHSAGFKDRQRVMVKSGETVRVIGNIRR